MKLRNRELSTSDNSEFRAETPELPRTARVGVNGNATLLAGQTDLHIEELEPVIAPEINLSNHNETFVAGEVDLQAEELEPVIAPIGGSNHNETFVAGEVDLQAEELEPVIAPNSAWGCLN